MLFGLINFKGDSTVTDFINFMSKLLATHDFFLTVHQNVLTELFWSEENVIAQVAFRKDKIYSNLNFIYVG